MTNLARILVLIILIFAFKAYAQPRDEPIGAPYNVGPKGDDCNQSDE